MALSAMYVASHLKVKAIASFTEAENTPKIISRISSSIPIFAMSLYQKTLNRVVLFRGVYPILFTGEKEGNIDAVIIKLLKEAKIIYKRDRIVLTKGEIYGKIGATNLIKILEIE